MTRGVLTALFIVLALHVSLAQQATFRSNVSLVRVDVLATDRGKPIPNLTAEDFDVFDNGVLQKIDAVFGDDEPLDVLFTFDRSGSVQGLTLRRLQEAASALLDELHPTDRAGLLTFRQTFALQAPFTNDAGVVRDAINAIKAEGATSLLDTLYAALMIAENSSRRTLILLFTDGMDNQSWLSESEVLAVAREGEAIVYAVPFRRGEQTLLGDVADATGGRVVTADSSERLQRVFLDVLSEMRSRYLLTFAPDSSETSGWHTLDVRLKKRSGRITARSGYFVRGN